MSKNHRVDTSRIAEQPKGGMPVTRENTQHPSLRDMPPSNGSLIGRVEVPQRNATPKPVVAGVDRSATRHPAIEELPVPASSEFSEPGTVVAGEELPAWLA